MKSLMEKLLLFLVKIKKREEESFNPYNISNDISKLLIMLPEDEELIKEVIVSIHSIQKNISKTFLVEKRFSDIVESNKETTLIVYSKEDKSIFKLPKKSLIKRIKQKNFDTVIDCNLKDSVFHYWILKNVFFKYRIAFYKNNSEIFNNLVLKLNSEQNTDEAYKKLFSLINL